MPTLLPLGMALRSIGLVAANVIVPVITPPARLRREESTGLDIADLESASLLTDFIGYYWSVSSSEGTTESILEPVYCGEGRIFMAMVMDSTRTFGNCCDVTDDNDGYSSQIATECSGGVAYSSGGSKTW